MTGEVPDLPAGAFVIDPVFGRVVVVPDRLLRKVRRKHGAYFAPLRRDILDVVRHPDATGEDPRGRHRHRYARRGPGPTTWLFVVVEYDYRGLGTVVTAFPKRRLPGH
jgi:hypothetical protein